MMTETLMVVEPHEEDRTAPSAFVREPKPSLDPAPSAEPLVLSTALGALIDPASAREPDPSREAEADQLSEKAHDLRGDAQPLDDRGQVAYDSADRRRAMAAGMEGKADAATVDARVTADVAQGKPATEVTRTSQGRAAKARPNRAQASRQAQRGLTR